MLPPLQCLCMSLDNLDLPPLTKRPTAPDYHSQPFPAILLPLDLAKRTLPCIRNRARAGLQLVHRH